MPKHTLLTNQYLQHLKIQQNTILKSTYIGCYYCQKIYKPKDIKEWVNKITAICPHCQIDSITGDALGLRITTKLLQRLYEISFKPIIHTMPTPQLLTAIKELLTTQPYISIIDNWIIYKQDKDKYHLFLGWLGDTEVHFGTNKSIHYTDANFREKTLKLLNTTIKHAQQELNNYPIS